MKHQLTFITDGANVKRYHTVSTLQAETVGHHSHGVALICLLLSPNCSADLLRAALLHDLAEHQTGDIPSPAKRLYNVSEQVNAMESDILSAAGLPPPQLHPLEQRVLKLADLAQGAIFCSRELALGNTRLFPVFQRYMSYAWELKPIGRERELFSNIQEMTV